MPRFYSSVPIPASQLWQLPQTIFHHAVRVLRLKVGDEFTLFDGTGVEHSARLVAIEKHSAEVALLSQQLVNRESPLHLTLAQALIHHDKMDWVIQKAVELGVKEIMPIVTERSQVKLSQDKAQQRSERWQNIAISACEQSGRNHLPVIHVPQALESWLTQLSSPKRLMLHPQATLSLSTIDYQQGESVVFAVGPEGGFSEEEKNKLLRHQFIPLALGPRILRTESAGLAALACAELLWGDF